MKPLVRTQSIIFTLTTGIIFYLWGYLESIISNNPPIGLAFGGLIALGTYRLILQAITFLIDSVDFFKKLLFGTYYLEGTWIGVYINFKKEPVYFIEQYEQSFDNLVIRGRAFFNDGGFKGSWINDSVSIDATKGILSYSYHRNSIEDTFLNQGQAEFNFVRNKKATQKMIGFYCDLYSTEKTKALIVKVDNANDKELIIKARLLFDENKDLFNKDLATTN